MEISACFTPLFTLLKLQQCRLLVLGEHRLLVILYFDQIYCQCRVPSSFDLFPFVLADSTIFEQLLRPQDQSFIDPTALRHGPLHTNSAACTGHCVLLKASGLIERARATAATASTLAPVCRALPIDPTLHAASTRQVRDLPAITTAPSLIARATSPLPSLGQSISRPSSASILVQYQPNYNHALPGLSTLASVASDSSPQLGYVISDDAQRVWWIVALSVGWRRRVPGASPMSGPADPIKLTLCYHHRSYNAHGNHHSASHALAYSTSSPGATTGGVSGLESVVLEPRFCFLIAKIPPTSPPTVHPP